MRKIKVALLAALVMVLLSATALAGTMYVNRKEQKSIKLYNANDEVICKIPYRAAVETHSRSKIDNERMEVGYKGHWGWVYSRYLSSTKPPKVEETSTKESSSSKKNTSSKNSSSSKGSSASKDSASSKSSSSSKDNSSSQNKTAQVNVFAGMKAVTHYTVVVRPSTPTGYVNLRWAPSKEAKIRTTRYNGDSLRVIAENKSWAQVMDDSTGECGFMMKSFLEKEDLEG